MERMKNSLPLRLAGFASGLCGGFCIQAKKSNKNSSTTGLDEYE